MGDAGGNFSGRLHRMEAEAQYRTFPGKENVLPFAVAGVIAGFVLAVSEGPTDELTGQKPSYRIGQLSGGNGAAGEFPGRPRLSIRSERQKQ